MAGERIAPSFIKELIQRSDLVDLISSKVTLKRQGAHNFVGLCPFHQEKTPSFSVNAQEQFYYCFGCQENGDALSFIMKINNLQFAEAVEELAALNGMSVVYEEGRQIDEKEQVRMEEGLLALADAAHFFQQQLFVQESATARAYLRNRGLKKSDVERFSLGYAPNANALLTHLSGKYSKELLFECGLIKKNQQGSYYDAFRHRIMFPIKNARGQIIAFGGRALSGDQQPKYLNSAESGWFHKSRELYGLHQAIKHKTKRFVVVEGYMDVVQMAHFGFYEAVATLGTSIGEAHIKQLKKRGQKTLFCFDGDTAGRNAAERALKEVFKQYDDKHEWRFAFLPQGEDPDSLLQKGGENALHYVLGKSITASQFLKQLMQFDEQTQWTIEKRAQKVKEAELWLELLPSGAYRDILRQELESDLHLELNVRTPLIRKKTQPQRVLVVADKEWKLISLMLDNLYLVDKVEGEMIAALEEEMPFLYELWYFARAGADQEMLKTWIEDNDSFAKFGKEYVRSVLPKQAQEEEFISALAILNQKLARKKAITTPIEKK